jgi:hypothetical protein
VSLYRRPGRASTRTVVVVALAVAALGLGAGFTLGRVTAPEPTLADKVADLHSSLEPARAGVELAATEFAQAVRGGAVVAPTEYGAARADVERAQQVISAHQSDLRAVGRALAVNRAVRDLALAVDRKVDAARVKALSVRAGRELQAVGG